MGRGNTVNVDDLVRTLADRAVELYIDGDRLRFRAPGGALTPELRGKIAVHRLAIIEYLRTGATTTIAAASCGNCHRRNWRDDPPKDGRIRTTCGKCGRFIGYRPAATRMA
jgi:hypothetical protein